MDENISNDILTDSTDDIDNISAENEYELEPYATVNTVTKYVKISPVEAIQWTGSNKEEIETFYGNKIKQINNKLIIKIKGNEQIIFNGNYLIKGLDMFYVLSKQLFEKMYVPFEVPDTLSSITDYIEDDSIKLKNLEIQTVTSDNPSQSNMPNDMFATNNNQLPQFIRQQLPISSILKIDNSTT